MYKHKENLCNCELGKMIASGKIDKDLPEDSHLLQLQPCNAAATDAPVCVLVKLTKLRAGRLQTGPLVVGYSMVLQGTAWSVLRCRASHREIFPFSVQVNPF